MITTQPPTTDLGDQRRRRPMRLLVASSVIWASVVAGAVPATAIPSASGAAAVTSTSTMPPEPGSTLGRRIAHLARQEVGAHERTGQNDYPRKYQRANKHIVYGEAWCGIFTYWVWTKAGVVRRPSMNPSRGNEQGHYATYWQEWASDHQRWKPLKKRNPEVGDLVVYGTFAVSGHIGVVVDVKYNRRGKATHIRTVEGNLSNHQVGDLGWRKLSELTGNGQKASGFVSPTKVPR